MKQFHASHIARKAKILTLMAASFVLTACATTPQNVTRASVDDSSSPSATSEPSATTEAEVAANSSVSSVGVASTKKSLAVPASTPAEPIPPTPAAKSPSKKPSPKPVAKPVVKPTAAVATANKSKNSEPVIEQDRVAEHISSPIENTIDATKSVELAFADKALEAEPKSTQGFSKLRSLDDLPLAFSEGWLLQLSALPLSKDKVCVLHNEQGDIFDGYETTSVEAWMTPQKVMVKSKSNFDLSYPESGLTLHDNEGVALDNFTLAATVSESVVGADFPANRYARKQSLKLVVKTGFWPTWPITETRTIGFIMNNYHSMLSSLQDCATLLQSNQ